MVYTMKIYVDGGCRRNGCSNAIGAAAAVRMMLGRRYTYWTRRLLSDYSSYATNQRAEITAIILGLEMAIEKYDELEGHPGLKLTIYSDSKYAVDCMNDWIYKWSNNGWVNCRGEDVVNQDLIRKASSLDDRGQNVGSVKYVWISRSENETADRLCNAEMDAMEEEEGYYN